MKFNERLVELRNEKHLSQARVAKDTGLSKSAIGRWELAQAEPNVTAIITLAKYFEVSTDILLGLKDY